MVVQVFRFTTVLCLFLSALAHAALVPTAEETAAAERLANKLGWEYHGNYFEFKPGQLMFEFIALKPHKRGVILEHVESDLRKLRAAEQVAAVTGWKFAAEQSPDYGFEFTFSHFAHPTAKIRDPDVILQRMATMGVPEMTYLGRIYYPDYEKRLALEITQDLNASVAIASYEDGLEFTFRDPKSGNEFTTHEVEKLSRFVLANGPQEARASLFLQQEYIAAETVAASFGWFKRAEFSDGDLVFRFGQVTGLGTDLARFGPLGYYLTATPTTLLERVKLNRKATIDRQGSIHLVDTGETIRMHARCDSPLLTLSRLLRRLGRGN